MARKGKKRASKSAQITTVTGPLTRSALLLWIVSLGASGAWDDNMVSNHMLVKAIVAEVGAVLLMLLWLFENRRATHRNVFQSPAILVFAALFVFGTLSRIWAVNPDYFVFKWLMWLAGAIAFFLALQIRQQNAFRLSAARALVACGVVVALVGILQYFGVIHLPKSAALPASTFGNKNMASHAIVMIWPFSLYLLSRRDAQSADTWLGALGLGAMLVFLFYTTTRAAWMGVYAGLVFTLFGLWTRRIGAFWLWFAALVAFGIVSALVYLKTYSFVWLLLAQVAALAGAFVLFGRGNTPALGWGRQQWLAMTVATILTLIMVNFSPQGVQPVWSVLDEEIGSIGDYAADDSSRRYQIWSSALDIARQKPVVGGGLGSYFHSKKVMRDADGQTLETIQTLGIQRVHNDVIELGVELGLVGVGLFLAFCLLLAHNVYRGLQQDPPPDQFWFLVALMAGLAGILVNAQFSFPFQVAVPLVLFGVYAAWIIRTSIGENQLAAIPIGRGLRAVAIGASVLLALFTLAVNAQWLHAFESINDRVVVEAKSPVERRQAPKELGWETPLVFESWFFHPEYKTLLKDTAKAYFAIGKYPQAVAVLRSVSEYSADDYEINQQLARSYTEMRRFDEARHYLPGLIDAAPLGDFSNQLMLMTIAAIEQRSEEVEQIYATVAAAPVAQLLAHPTTLRRLHTTAAELRRLDDVHRWYKLYTERYGLFPTMETNQAVVLMTLDNDPRAAAAHMRNSIRLNPGDPNNARFEIELKKLDSPSADL